ncbi:hypothetical protein JKP88DRAFT_250994 [Tribonema minus]|uniref:AB hydrolase-1 domain-containing protein n=1 Tax=Tribonema minus TaxID=303371 RepID=A0A836CNT6_9STRA|nr:hypothetical protein JKP88DRAFT_250994 [Tribonema minus]
MKFLAKIAALQGAAGFVQLKQPPLAIVRRTIVDLPDFHNQTYYPSADVTFAAPASRPHSLHKPTCIFIPGVEFSALSTAQYAPSLRDTLNLAFMCCGHRENTRFEDLREALASYIGNKRGVVLVGESFGALLALDVAFEKHVRLVILLNSATAYPISTMPQAIDSLRELDEIAFRCAIIYMMVQHGPSTKINVDDLHVLTLMLLNLLLLKKETLVHRADTWIKAGCERVTPKRLRRLDRKVVIVAGEDDELFPSTEEAEALHKMIPNSRVLVVKSNHLITADAFDINEVIREEFESRYLPAAECITSAFASCNISASVDIVRFTCPLLYHLEAASRVEEIACGKKRVLLVGHSQGAYQSAAIARNLKIPLVQWAGGAYERDNSIDYPLLTILCEDDVQHPCIRALTQTYPTYHQTPAKSLITMPHADHFYGVDSEDEAENLAEVIADFGAFAHFRDTGHVVAAHISKTASRFSHLIHEAGTIGMRDWCERLQSRLEDKAGDTPSIAVKKRRAEHHVASAHMMTSVLAIAMPWLDHAIDKYFFFPAFVCSHPDDYVVHLYTPSQNFGLIGNLLCRGAHQPFALVKLKHEGTNATAKALNEATFTEAFELLTDEERLRYETNGRQMNFGDDIEVPHIPLCSLVWLAMPVSWERDATGVTVRSPVLKTAVGNGVYGSRLNAKLITIPRVLEWLLVESFKQ